MTKIGAISVSLQVLTKRGVVVHNFLADMKRCNIKKMADALLTTLRRNLPNELSRLLDDQLTQLEQGKYKDILSSNPVKVLLGHEQNSSVDEILLSDFNGWNDYIFHRLGILLANRDPNSESGKDTPAYRQHQILLVALAALQAFLQSNVTGPPLPFSSAEIIFTSDVHNDASSLRTVKAELVGSISVDGVAAYKLTPNIELLCLADTILTSPAVKKNVKVAEWVALRIAFVHQRLLSETTSTLQTSLYEKIIAVDKLITESYAHDVPRNIQSQWLLEKATIHTHHGFDKLAQQELDRAKDARKFDFALTGLLGKRTKWQEKETSQLVVLARSYEEGKEQAKDAAAPTGAQSAEQKELQPENLDLNDDTLLESISFTEKTISTVDFQDQSSLPPSLTSLDPSAQPLLHPLDSILLLSLASSITNTSPADGLTREETLPYAVRVLDGGSSNWQIYTQALLVRSRIEGYRSRTTERGLLQLQALVDQVIAETTSSAEVENSNASTFLPRPKASESASVAERLQYIYPLSSPLRWDLEAELAARWVSLGGLRSALDIYERLELWAEAALCWAAVDREDCARRTVRRQLFHASSKPVDTSAHRGEDEDVDNETYDGPPLSPPPLDAPRLYCILGDIDHDITMYEAAWTVSNCRYARAQRSLGRNYIQSHDYAAAASAYTKALSANQLNGGSWFALGCALLELEEYERAAEAFSRTVQLDDTDAEAWSNLAAALLRKGPDAPHAPALAVLADDEETNTQPDHNSDEQKDTQQQQQRHIHDALIALKKAAFLKRDSHRIWDNLLTVSASLRPPSHADILTSLQHIVRLRGSTDGEACIDIPLLALLVRDVTAIHPADDATRPGLPRMVVRFVEGDVTPLITSSRKLWGIVAEVALWRGRSGSALAAHEKAWRAVTTGSVGWEAGTEEQWGEIVDVTVELVDAYESLGVKERGEGEGLGAGEVVMKDWRFKARSAIRGVMGKGKGSWEGTAGWERLVARMEGLKGSNA